MLLLQLLLCLLQLLLQLRRIVGRRRRPQGQTGAEGGDAADGKQIRLDAHDLVERYQAVARHFGGRVDAEHGQH